MNVTEVDVDEAAKTGPPLRVYEKLVAPLAPDQVIVVLDGVALVIVRETG